MNKYTFLFFGYSPALEMDDHIEVNIEASSAAEATKKFLMMVIDKRIFPKSEPTITMIGDVSVVTSLN
jgi:hypothetical protein